jgi:hypothetical protein
MSTATIYPYPVIDQPFYNATATAIPAGEVVMFAAATTALKSAINPFATTPGPLATEGTVDTMTVIQGVETGGAGDAAAVGVSLAEIPATGWGMVRLLGPTLCKTIETVTDAHLTSYGLSPTDGQLEEITASTSLYTVAFQVNASGTTSAADKRNVMVVCTGPQIGVGWQFGIYA